MDRVFLDANVLFSVAYRADSSLRRLWELDRAQLLTSAYALDEAMRNLDVLEARERLRTLQADLEIAPFAEFELELPARIRLPEDDRPILAAAMALKASHLLTGDLRAFGRYFGRKLGGVLVLRPAEDLRLRVRG